MKTEMSEMKTTLAKIKNRLDGLKEKIRELEDRAIKTIQNIKHGGKNGIKQNKWSNSELWGNFKQLNSGVIGVTKGEKKGGDAERKYLEK